jgi:hypothetical protein
MYDIEGVGFGMACAEYDGHVRLMIGLYGKNIERKLPIKSNASYDGHSIAMLVAKMLRHTADEMGQACRLDEANHSPKRPAARHPITRYRAA